MMILIRDSESRDSSSAATVDRTPRHFRILPFERACLRFQLVRYLVWQCELSLSKIDICKDSVNVRAEYIELAN